MAYINLTEAARRMGVTSLTLRRYVKIGRLPAVKLPGGHWRVEESAIVDMMAKPREKAQKDT